MDHVLTLIAARGGLDESMIGCVQTALLSLGASMSAPVWLSPSTAADVPFSLLSPDQAAAAARRALSGQAVDIVAQGSGERRKKLLLADMDSTMVTGETLDELADFAGLKDHIAAITARAMNGEIDFKTAVRERVGLLRGLSTDSLEKAFKRMVFTPGGRELVRTMRANGARTILVSGGFKFFTSRVRDYCGFHADIGNRLEVARNSLTGQVIEPILDRDTKLRTLLESAASMKIPMSLTLAVGDGANDLDMIRASGLGVAFHAKPIVAAAAAARIDHGDLKALLYAQGYREEEIVS